MMKTPIKFSLSNEKEPLTTELDRWLRDVIGHMVYQALIDRDGTIVLNVTPKRIDCEYTPTEKGDAR